MTAARRFALPTNFTYDDPLPFECDTSVNASVSIGIYCIQAGYLLLGAVLNGLIIRNTFWSKNTIYKTNSFYLLYTADAAMGIYISVSEILFGRLILLITPLCPILSPFFFTPSIITKFYYMAVHYASAFKTVSQIFMSLNRMTCVVLPMRHARLWKMLLRPVLAVLFISPLGAIWTIIPSRVYVNPSGGGFSVNYKDAIPHFTVSLLHLIYSVIGFIFVIVCFFITIFGLVMLERRVKSTEKSLTAATMLMALQMMVFAFIQIYFAFFAAASSTVRQLLLVLVVIIFDSMNVSSPIALILMSKQLRQDLFSSKSDRTLFVASKVPSVVSQQQAPFRSISTVSAPIISQIG